MDRIKSDHRFRRRLQSYAPLLVTAALLYGYYRYSADTQNSAGKATLSNPSIRGTTVPALELLDLEGRTVRLQDFKDKVVLLNFWGTTCAPCMTEIPWLVEFQRQYGPKGLQVVAASMYGEGPEILKPFVTKHEMEELRTVIGNEQAMTMFGLVAFPTTFIVDREGKYYSRHDGLIDRALVEKELTAVLSQP